MCINEIVSRIKESFEDVTFAGEDNEYAMYDVGLEDYSANVNIHKDKQKTKIVVIDVDGIEINETTYNSPEDVVHFLELPLYKHIWNHRKSQICRSKKAMENWKEKHQHEYDQELLIDEHPYDGWVVYHL